MPRRAKEAKEKLVPFSARFTPRTKGRLDALAFCTKESAYGILEKAFCAYWDSLPDSLKSKAEKVAAAVEE